MVERKIVGPSYSEVASKYEATEENYKLLAERVIAGSVGIWGEIPMVPHPSLSQENAEQMIKYVLLLKQ
jgi:cytochrome c